MWIEARRIQTFFGFSFYKDSAGRWYYKKKPNKKLRRLRLRRKRSA